MKITFVVQDLFLQGAQYATAKIASRLVAQGHMVEVVLSKVHQDRLCSGHDKPFALSKDVARIMLPYRRARWNIWRLRQHLKSAHADVVISMSPTYTKALFLTRLLMRKNFKLIHVEHELVGVRDDGSIVQPARRLSFRWIGEKIFWSVFDRIFVVSQKGRDDWGRVRPYYPIERVHVVYNPVIDEDFFNKMSQKPSHSWLKNKQCSTWVTAGAYDEYKGHMTILRAACMIRDRGIKVRFVIFGRGHLEESYRTYISENHLEDYVSIAGFTNNFPAEVGASDGFVLSSNSESFGIVLVEALAAGVPIVSTDPPFGPREILKGGMYGRMVMIKDHQALANAIIDAIAIPSSPPPPESWRRFTVEASAKLYIEGILGW